MLQEVLAKETEVNVVSLALYANKTMFSVKSNEHENEFS